MYPIDVQITLRKGRKLTVIVLVLYIVLSTFNSNGAQMELVWLFGTCHHVARLALWFYGHVYFNQCHHHCRRLRIPSQNGPIWGANCLRAIRDLVSLGKKLWNHWMNSSRLEFKSLSRWCVGTWYTEHRPQYSKVVQGQQKTKYLVWTLLVHSTRKMKAFDLLVLLMAMGEDHTIRVVQQHLHTLSTTQAGLSHYSIGLLEIIYFSI